MVAFRCYVDRTGADKIRQWYDAQEGDVRAEMDAVIEVLQELSYARWDQPMYRELDGKPCQGLGHIRLITIDPDTHRDVHYRVIGFYEPEQDRFTLLYCFKKNDDPTLVNSCPQAQLRRADLLANAGRVHDCWSQ